MVEPLAEMKISANLGGASAVLSHRTLLSEMRGLAFELAHSKALVVNLQVQFEEKESHVSNSLVRREFVVQHGHGVRVRVVQREQLQIGQPFGLLLDPQYSMVRFQSSA
jgi:hypothetical protein